MRSSVVILACTAALVGLVAASPPMPNGGDAAVRRVVEVRRIRAHFDSALRELATRDLSSLTTAQRLERASLLVTLRAYRDRGEFPHNYDFPGQAVPYFVDRKTGTLCAVAHLLASSGRRDMVDRIASADNNAYVMELASDTAFTAWLSGHGLTLVEAARIQVPYMVDRPPVISALGSRSNAYVAASAVAITGSAAASLWNTRGNADGHRALANVVGLTTGALTMGLGTAALGDRDAPAAVAPLALIAGGVTTYFSTRGFVKHRQYVSTERNRRLAQVSVAPILPVVRGNGTGIALHIAF